MGELICLEGKRKERIQPVLEKMELLLRAAGDKRLSKNDLHYLIVLIHFYIKKNGSFNEYLGEPSRKNTIKKLIACGYLERTEPFDWIVEEAFLGFSAGDSLGWFQEIILMEARSE